MLLFSVTHYNSQYKTRCKKSCKHDNSVHRDMPKIGQKLHPKAVCLLRTCLPPPSQNLWVFGVVTNKMIKREVSVTEQYWKHANQSLAPSEPSEPPPAVMGNKMEKWPSYWATLMGNGLTSHLEMPPANKVLADPELTPLVCSIEAVWPKSCWTSPITAWLFVGPVTFAFYARRRVTAPHLDPLTFTSAVTMAK